MSATRQIHLFFIRYADHNHRVPFGETCQWHSLRRDTQVASTWATTTRVVGLIRKDSSFSYYTLRITLRSIGIGGTYLETSRGG